MRFIYYLLLIDPRGRMNVKQGARRRGPQNTGKKVKGKRRYLHERLLQQRTAPRDQQQQQFRAAISARKNQINLWISAQIYFPLLVFASHFFFIGGCARHRLAATCRPPTAAVGAQLSAGSSFEHIIAVGVCASRRAALTPRDPEPLTHPISCSNRGSSTGNWKVSCRACPDLSLPSELPPSTRLAACKRRPVTSWRMPSSMVPK